VTFDQTGALVLSSFFILLTVATALIGSYWGLRAIATARGRGAKFRLAALGLFAPREAFTPEGWRYRQRALMLAALALIWLVGFVIAELLQAA
jgi:hypothetical protein